ncbi:hypothetical protein TM1040_2130 [Ruegeria sp. TM1040]|uniref:hypothetical protein n=1 Tax=Ruegeria sp. (strain TM1040) TaxID=292414 RepID=UPI0000462FA6|nr:hypothetical protein [Ruegeria sp. TM1040]ABF64862.1 hypothetical protein TM1040_2130 [Ruegeria sp. TM1040]
MGGRPTLGSVPGLGHNGGPSLEPGALWRTHAWRSAQKKLMPNTLPKLVLQMRLKRAAELGMDYKTYAKVRQTSGQDVLGLLFSSNALRLLKDPRLPEVERARLAHLKRAERLALTYPPLRPSEVARVNPEIDAADTAPVFTEGWTEMRAKLQGVMRQRGLSGASVLVIGDAPLENEWAAAGRAAAYLSAAEYFGASARRP